MVRKPRNLSPEERELWEKVARQTTRLAPLPRPVVEAPEPLPSRPVKTDAAGPQVAIPQFRIGARAGAAAPVGQMEAARISMDHKTWRKMKGGKLAPEARLDLHGLTLAQAHPRLNAFIEASAARGLRLVLVITGKGRPGSDENPYPSRPGALRRQVPHWLQSAPAVLQVSAASRRHGGEGALYVYLRRRRG